ncbi:MAG: hypothetical protein CK425_00695 [Parachlamydia sp.]|nr:MAG: hypothetical protein CK425_00695 [Parachlamydia sp.]
MSQSLLEWIFLHAALAERPAGIALLQSTPLLGFTSINESLKDFDDFIDNRDIPVQTEIKKDFPSKNSSRRMERSKSITRMLKENLALANFVCRPYL